MKVVACMFLYFAVLISAVEVVIARHETRKLFIEIQDLEKNRDQLNEEWGRLQLEQSTWATDDRVESFARMQLGMKNPERKFMVLHAK